MKLGKMEKITIAVLAVLIVWAAIYNCINFYQSRPDKMPHVTYFITSNVSKLPANIQHISHKYKGYENIYNSDKKVLTYGYVKYTTDKNAGEKFHKDLQKELSKEKLDYEVIPYKNWTDYDSNLESSNSAVYEGNSEKCLMENPSVEEIEQLRKTTSECMQNACIIDTKNNTYVVMSRDPQFIITTMKEYNKK